MHNHTIHQHQTHFGWNKKPASRQDCARANGGVSPGRFFGRPAHPKSTVADIATLDFGKVNPVAGPIYVEGAEPGDAIKVTLLHFDPSGWGWTANIPGFGLLADQFKDRRCISGSTMRKLWRLPCTGRAGACL